jgi:hypothetical protein
MKFSRSLVLAVCYLKGRNVAVAWLGSSGHLLLGYRGDARRARPTGKSTGLPAVPATSWSYPPKGKSMPFSRSRPTCESWHEYDAEDSLRFCGLRWHDAGMLRISPNTLLAEGADRRFVNELKRELKT